MMDSLDMWDWRFINIAKEVQSWSKDPSTKCGAVLVKDRRIIATGYNGFPMGISDNISRYLDRDYKLAGVVHAEPNALFNAARNGASTEGSAMYITWPPCSQCASAIIQSGIVKVVCPHPECGPERWRKQFMMARDLLYEAQVLSLHYNEECK